MTRRIIASRHEGAVDFIRGRAGPAEHHIHLTADTIRSLEPGDEVYGNLPADLVATICAQGARFFHLSVPDALRGEEATTSDLERSGARLVEIHARIIHEDEI